MELCLGMVKTFATFGTYPCFLESSQSRLQFANLEKFTVFQNQEAISSPVFAKKTLLFYSHMIELVVGALGRRRLPLFCKEAGPPHPPYNVGAARVRRPDKKNATSCPT